MTTTRRHFMQNAALATAFMGLSGPRASADPSTRRSVPGREKLDLLILGGTGFLGPHVVEEALARGHSMTLFNRGKTNPHLFPDLTKLRGDRDPTQGDGLTALEGKRWDAVIDTSAYIPRIATASARLLSGAVGQYSIVSTVSVYADFKNAGMDETAAVGKLEDESVEKVDGQTYGPLKALCEQAVERAMPGRTTSIRPGLIVGPRDRTDRFTYWPVRVQRGGEILAPGSPSDPVQYIDVRDLAHFIVRTLEQRSIGTYNAVGPQVQSGIAELLHGCKAVTGGDAKFTWVDADFLQEQEVAPWSHMPVWVPPTDDMQGLGTVSNARALDAGLTLRPLAETVRATLDWFGTLPEARQAKLRAGIDSEREAKVLAAWHAREAPSTRG